jgi:2-polyprenyl-3-methyl-5-hydroxy-6-metoxy-1,4-benzoquinol methylase
MYEIWNRLQYVLSPQFDIYEQLSRRVKGKVADVGSGTGFGTHLLTRNAKKVHGYEIDPRAREFSQRVFSNGNLSFYCVDITQQSDELIPLYDFITMVDVIEHIENDMQAILNCQKLLKEGGIFYCTTPNAKSRYRKSENHVREYKPHELFGLLVTVFNQVQLLDFNFKPVDSEFHNPIIARCE